MKNFILRDYQTLLRFMSFTIMGIISCKQTCAQNGLLLIEKASEQESMISSGNIRMVCKSFTLSLGESEKEIFQNQTSIDDILRLHKPDSTREYQVRFDNLKEAMWLDESSSPDHVHQVVSTTNAALKRLYIPAAGASKLTEVEVSKPSWPPPWPENLWRSRLVSGRLRVLKEGIVQAKLDNKLDSLGFPTVSIQGERADINQIISYDPHFGNLFKSIKLYDKKSGLLSEEATISYKKYNDGLFYMDNVVEKKYRHNGSGKNFVFQIVTTQVTDAILNIRLAEKDFAFADNPKGAIVQDNRFGNPISFVQGNKQFTDQELFASLKNPGILHSGDEPRASRQLSRTPYYVLPVSLLLIVIALGIARVRGALKTRPK